MIPSSTRLVPALLAMLLAACATTLPQPDEPPPARDHVAPAPGPALSIQPIDLDLLMRPLDREVMYHKDPYDRSSFPVQTGIDGRYVDGRATVSGSFTRIFRKKSLRIDLADGARWHDNRRISLNAMATDPSYLREWAAWDLAHALGMIGPTLRMVRLHINGDYIGPYMSFDWIDPAMMARRELGDDGLLYHPIDSAYCGDFGDPDPARLEECWFDLSQQGGDFSALSQLASGLIATPAEAFDTYLEGRFDVDSVINWIVLNTLTSNTDTYNKNFFLYLSHTSGMWHIIPWDYDLSFGRNADPILPFPYTILNDNFQYFYSPEAGNPSPLKEKVLANPALYARFTARLAHVLGEHRDPHAPEAAYGWFQPDRFRSRLEDWAATIRPEVEHDRYREWTLAEFEEHLEALDYYNLARFHLLRHQVLGTTVFDTARWLPYRHYPLIADPDPAAALERQHRPLDLSSTVTLAHPDETVVALDEHFSRPIAIFLHDNENTSARIRVEAETERAPRALPPSKSAGQCIERTWFIDLKTPDSPPLQPQLTLEYLQENSLRHEIGADIEDQNRLVLWAFTAQRWQRLTTHANSAAKILTTHDLTLRPGEVARLVACTD